MGGRRQVQNPDGTGYFTLPNGTQYSSDGNGNVWKDGEQIKENGNWLIDIDELNKRNEQFSKDPDNSKLSTEDLVGTWQINATFSDMESPLVGMLRSFFDELFGEGSGDEIVESSLEDVSLHQTAVIEADGNNVTMTLYSEDVKMVYSGSLRGNKLKLKLVSQSALDGGEDEDFSIPINKLEFTFTKESGVVTMSGSYRIDTTLFKATYSYHGTKS